MTSKQNERPLPPPAIQPPPGREPTREIWPVSRHWSEKYKTSVYIHRPPAGVASENKKLPVLYIHGIQSHPGWFFGSALALADAGYTVYQVTRRGSGDNTVKRGYASGVGSLYSDITTCIHEILGREGVEKVHLVGVSWGGKLVAAYAAQKEKYRSKIASVSLLAPGIVPKVDVPLTTKIIIAASKLLSVLLIIVGVFFQYILEYLPIEITLLIGVIIVCTIATHLLMQNVRFRIPLNDPELFTNNPTMQEYLRADEFQLHKVTAQFMYASRVIDWKLKFARAGSITIPTTLILANNDRIIDNEATEQRVRRLAGDNLEIVWLPGSHTLEFEVSPQKFFDEIVKSLARGQK